MNIIFKFVLGFGFYIASIDDAVIEDDDDNLVLAGGLVISIPFVEIFIYSPPKQQ